MVELTEVDAAQMANRQTQLEEAIGVMSQEIGTIKQLLERLVVLQAPTTTRVKLLLKGGVLSSKPLKPPRVVMQPHGVAQTLNKSLVHRPNLHTQLHQTTKERIPKLDHLDPITELYRASHRAP